MTRITSNKQLKRETGCTERLRPITVELFPFYCRIRVKGKREAFNVPWDVILAQGRKIEYLAAQSKRRSA